MRKICLMIVATVLFASISGLANAAGELVKINSIDSQIVIEKDGLVYITENISADFSASPGHGIYRDIPYAYKKSNGAVLYTEIEVLGVKDENTSSYQYELIKNDANLRIKIGDPDVLVYGAKKYIIAYSVKGILSSFDGYDEIYWNVVGTGWPSAIDSSSAVLILPEAGVVQAACYKGSLGSQTPCDSKEISGDRVNFYASNIEQGEAFTVAVGFNKGMVPLLSVLEPVPAYLDPKNIVIFSATVLVGLFGILILWWKNGRDIWWRRKSLFDPNAKEEVMPIGGYETIVPEYESPDGLRPAEIGVLKDETADTLDISATIVDLAIRGYLKIIEVPKKWMFSSVDYEILKLKGSDDKMLEYEKELFGSLFEIGAEAKLFSFSSFFKSSSKEEINKLAEGTDKVLLSDLKNKFYKKLTSIKDLLYKDVVNKKLFTANPQSIRNKHVIFGVLGIIASSFILIIGPFLAFGLGALAVAVIYLIVGLAGMVQRTAYGRETYRKVKGYELFLSSTEKYRQPFFENENTFMEVLPYAMVFGVTKKLAKAMENMGIKPQQPVWFVGHSGTFNIGEFGSSIESLSKSLSTSMASAPGGSGSGGGGGAGGGGGGRGGGGW